MRKPIIAIMAAELTFAFMLSTFAFTPVIAEEEKGNGMPCMTVERPAQFTLNGSDFPEEYQDTLTAELGKYGIGWWAPYAVCQAYQESRFDIYAQNKNGLDKGLFQFRITYWNEYCSKAGMKSYDIFDAKAQIRAYAYSVATKLAAGETVEQVISDHYTGGAYYDQTYVSDVLQWLDKFERNY